MAVRIADTLKQQNNLTTFPVAYGEDIWLDENKGSGTADYDTLQNLYNDGKLGGSSIQVETMPAASASNVGKIVQYVGETGSYEHGCFYECKNESGSYAWRYISTVKNGVFYTSDNITDSTIYPVGSVAVYTGEPIWGLFKGHHYEYVEDTPLTTYKFNGTKNGETLSFFLANKELEVGSALVRTSDGYIVSYVSAINGTTITVQGRTYTETFTNVVETGETEEVASYTGWIDIGGGGSDGGEDGTSIFYGTMDEWDALSTDAKKQYDYMADSQSGNENTFWSGFTTIDEDTHVATTTDYDFEVTLPSDGYYCATIDMSIGKQKVIVFIDDDLGTYYTFKTFIAQEERILERYILPYLPAGRVIRIRHAGINGEASGQVTLKLQRVDFS